MAMLVLTVQAAGQVYHAPRVATPTPTPSRRSSPLAGMALTYFFVNTVPIAVAIALTTNQNAVADLEDRFRVERAELPARRRRRRRRHQGDARAPATG